MRVILTDDVVGVGDIGEIVNVRPGYGRNFLIPRGIAIEAASANAKQIAHHQRQIDAKKKVLKNAAEERRKELEALKLEISLRVGSGGKVFGSVTSRDIAAKLAEAGFEIDRRRVILGDPIKKLGSQKVKVKLHADVISEVEVVVTPLEVKQEEEDREAAKEIAAVEERFAENADEEIDEQDLEIPTEETDEA